MQDPSMYSQINLPQFPEQEHLKCPRCDSDNTKFCYYNNYNLSQPRHFCKNCKRYWTKGGALRNIPVGGGSRKNTKRTSSTTKRPSSSSSSSATSATPSSSPSSAAAVSASSSSSPSTTAQQKTEPYGSGPVAAQPGFDQGRTMILDASRNGNGNGGFSSILSANGGQFGNFDEGLQRNGSSLQLYGFGDHDPNRGPGLGDPQMGLQNGSNSEEGFLSGQSNGDSSCWNGSNGWPGLSIYTPGSTFQ